jgi:hypothetical protein
VAKIAAMDRQSPPLSSAAPDEAARLAWTRAETWGVFAIIALFWAALSWPWLSGALTIPWDAKAHFQPQLQFLARSLAEGQSPFWNPHVFAGHPQIADPQALIFSPPHLLAAWLFPKPGMVVADAVVLGMLLLGAFAIAALFRDRAWAPAGAVVAALVFAFGASAAWRIQHVGQVMSLAYFAIALWLLSRALGRQSGRYGLLAGFAAGLMLLGRDQVALIGAYTLAGLTLAAIVQAERPWRALRLSVKPLLAMALAALATAAIPILFTLILAESSNRPAIDLTGAGQGSLHPASLLTLVVANLFGAAGPLENFWGQPSPAWNQAFGDVDLFLARNMSVAYVGALPLIAILLVGVLAGRAWDKPIRPVAIAALITLLYALGRYTPAFQGLFQLLPGVSFYRRPADALFNFGALAAILAGYCVHVAATTPVLAKRWRWAAVAALIAGGVIGAAALAVAVGRGPVALIPLISAVLLFVLGAAMLWFLPKAQASAPLGAALFVAAILGLDLAVSNGPSESTGLPSAQYDVLRPDSANETVALIRRELARHAAPDRRDRVELAGIDFHWPNASMTHGFDHTLGYNPLRLGLYSRATGAGDHVALPDQRRFSPLFPGYDALLADLLGLRLVATREPLPAPGGLRFIARTADAYLYENPRALPRVLAPARAERIDREALLITGAWPPGFDPRRTVLLSELPVRADCTPASQPGRAAITGYANTRISVTVVSTGCGYLVLNDVWQRWWTAEVNGEPVPILEANGLFRAVAVPDGEAVVTFRFAPFSGLLDDLLKRTPRWLIEAGVGALDRLARLLQL